MNLYLIDKYENVIDVIPDGKIMELTQNLEINQADVLNGTIALNKGLQLRLDDVRYFAVPDKENKHNLWMYRKTIIKVENDDILIQGVNAFYDDLKAYGYIKDKRPNAINAAQAMGLVLGNTRWNIDFVDSALTNSSAEVHDTNFYYLTYLDSVKKIEDEWNIEVQSFINIEGNKITRKYVNLYKRMGVDKGKRFVYGKSALEIVKESNDTDVYTALIGRGAGLPVEDENGQETGGFTRKINFADVSWSKANGDPIDKPLGQEWIEWPEATKEYGYSDGTPRFGIVDFDNEQDPNNLLKETWEALKKSAIPAVQFSATVGDVGFLSLGETVAVIRYDMDIKYQTRVTNIEWNRKNENASKITLGDKLVQSASDRYRSVQAEAYKARSAADEATDKANFALSNGGSTVEWGPNEPAHPKEGDIWYESMPDGSVVMKQYENGQWVIRIDDTTGEQIKNKVEQAEEDVKQLKTDAEDAQNYINKRLADNDSKIDRFGNEVNNANNNIANVQKQVNDVNIKSDNIKNTADNALDIAYDAKNGLVSKVDSSTFNSSMQQVDNAIQTKVSSDDFNTRVTQLDNAIQTKVSSDTFYSQITQLSNGISSTVAKIDNLQVGGTNLLPYTKTFDGWYKNNSDADFYVYDNKGYKDFIFEHLWGDWSGYSNQYDPKLVPGNTYTISAWVRGIQSGDIDIDYYEPYAPANIVRITQHINSEWKRYSKTFVAQSPTYPYGNRRGIEAAGNWGNVAGSVYVAGIKLEEGNIATDWSPSPNDLATQTQITQLNDSIQTKVSNAEYQSEITQISNGIQSNVNNINGLRSDTYSQITQLSNSINTKVSSTDFYSRTAQLADGIASTVAKVDNLQIGGTNMLPHTKTFDGWNSWGNAYIERANDHPYKDFDIAHLYGDWARLEWDYDIPLEKGKKYTISAWIRGYGSGAIDVNYYDSYGGAPLTNYVTSEWKRYSVTFTAGDLDLTYGNRRDIEAHGNWGNVMGSVYVAGMKLEEGDFATDWSPAPGDMASRSDIIQLYNGINLKVSKGEVVNQINISTEGILIDGSKTHITGQTVIDNAVIRDSNIANLSASKLTAGWIDANRINVVNLNGWNIQSNTISADKLNANAMLIGLNNSLTNMQIYQDGLILRENGNQSLVLNKTGIHVHDYFNNEDVGWIHTNEMVGSPWMNGLAFDLNEAGDFMGWGVFNSATNVYDAKLTYYKTAYGNNPADIFEFSSGVKLPSIITPTNDWLKVSKVTISGNECVGLTCPWGANAGIAISGNTVFLKTATGWYDLNEVIHSIGKNVTWN